MYILETKEFKIESCYILQNISTKLRLRRISIYEIEYDYKINTLYQIYRKYITNYIYSRSSQ